MIGRPVCDPLTGLPGVGVLTMRFAFRSDTFALR
jgi:hypothetical protein